MSQTVDVAVPVYGPQFSQWWFPIMGSLLAWQRSGIEINLMLVSAAMPDAAKNMASTSHMMGNNTGITSAQRNELVGKSKAEWIFFLDHDTVPPVDALPKLLDLHQPFVAGVYYHRNDPYAPLMYKRVENGLYKIVFDFEKGTLMTVDAVGMGCTLIHRSVFETIHRDFRHFQRSNGTNFIQHKDDIVGRGLPSEFRVDKPMVFQGPHGWHVVTPLTPVERLREEKNAFPFFDMEEGRTEDIAFCEHAERVGFKPLVDTSIECNHWNPIAVKGDWFREARDAVKISGEDSPVTDNGGMA